MPHPQAKLHRMFELAEPIATVTFPRSRTRRSWPSACATTGTDTSPAGPGRAAPLGLAPAEVVHAVFYNFADGEVARHIPWVWG
jgi:hypothetical protein